MADKLIAEEGLLKGLELPLPPHAGEEWGVGRDPALAQLVLADPEAAPLHFLLRRDAAATLVAVSVADTPPVLINGTPLVGEHSLHAQDQIQVGSTLFRYRTDQPQEPSQPVPPPDAEFEEGEEITSSPEEITEAAEAPPDESPEAAAEEEEEPSEYRATADETETPPAEETLEHDEEPFTDTLFEEESADGSIADTLLAEVNFDMLETGRWLLKVVGGPNNGAEFNLQSGETYLIGTDPNSCDVIFHDTSVSRQHARLSVSDEETLVIEDLRSRNGTLIEGRKIEGREVLPPNTVVTLGTTSFIVFDREGEMQTVISPMLPSIVKVLQDEEERKAEAAPPPPPVEEVAAPPPPPHSTVVGTFVLTAVAAALIALVGLGTLALFHSEPVEIQKAVDYDALIKKALGPYRDVQFTFNPPTGRLRLVGHVLTPEERDQIIYNLDALPFKVLVDNNLIIDDITRREVLPSLYSKPAWKDVTIQVPEPGVFILSGHIQTREQADRLLEYLNANFPSLDNIRSNLIVEEDVLRSARALLQKAKLRDVRVNIEGNELVFTGGVPTGMEAAFQRVADEIKVLSPGIRSIRNDVAIIPPEANLINISDRYHVTGSFSQSGKSISVVINGRIVGQGDIIDGLTITNIKPSVIFLEKDGVRYRIDY